MKRNLIAVILASLATAAFAEPTLQVDENRLMNAPEATSYIADRRARRAGRPLPGVQPVREVRCRRGGDAPAVRTFYPKRRS